MAILSEMVAATPYRVDIEPLVAYGTNRENTAQGIYLFVYTITIRNVNRIGVGLTARRWIITDQADNVQEVRGSGGGEQPYIAAGDPYQYTRSAAINPPIRMVAGSYTW